MTAIRMKVDGVSYQDEVEPRMLLVHYLREQLGKTGTVVGCDTSNCGACTVHLDGSSVKSCTVLAVQADGHDVDHDRGAGAGRRAPPDAAGVPREPRAAVRLLHPRDDHAEHRPPQREPGPTEEEVRDGLEGNLCRCTGYQNIVKAVAQRGGDGSDRHDSHRGPSEPSPRSGAPASARRTSA